VPLTVPDLAGPPRRETKDHSSVELIPSRVPYLLSAVRLASRTDSLDVSDPFNGIS